MKESESESATAACRVFGQFAVAFLLLLLLFIPKASVGQSESTGTILGTVKDSSGAIVPQTKVTVVNTGTNDTRVATTGEDGAFRFPALAAGPYSISVEKAGFKTQTQTGLTLEVTQELVVNLVLEVGASSQTVTVTGQAATVNTTNSALGALVNPTQMAELPLNGRNYTDLTFLQPGVVNSTNSSASSSQGGQHGTFFSVDGGQMRMNLYSLDGTNITDTRGNGPASESGGTSLGVGGIQEFKVVTGTFDATYGLEPSSQIVMVSKGGTNQFHGEVFEYLRNDDLDAANYYDAPTVANGEERLPHFERNNFGADGGGPFKKDKSFFYAAYEGLKQTTGITVVDTVPGAGCHGPAGNNTGVVTSAACPQLGSGTSQVTINPSMSALLGLYPSPNLPNDEFTNPAAAPETVNWGQIRVDQNFSAADSMFVRYTTDKSNGTCPSSCGVSVSTTGNTSFPQFAETLESHDQFLTISETHIFSSALLNQIRPAWTRTEYHDVNIWPISSYSPNGLASMSGPNLSLVTGQGVGVVSISGYSGNGQFASNPQGSGLEDYQLYDDLFYTKGKHSFKFGTAIYRYDMPYHQGTNSGSVSFTSLANFLQGFASSWSAVQGGNQSNAGMVPPNHFRNDWWWVPGWYAQDDWKVLPTLTLNLGLRYDFNTVPTDSQGRNVNLVNDTDPTTTIGEQFAEFPRTNFSPRIGFAWDVQGNGKTSVRGGIGRYFDYNMTDGLISNKIQETPYDASRSHIPAAGTVVTLPLTFSPTDLFSLSLPPYHEGNPEMYKWNFAIQRQLTPTMTLQLGYVGTRGLHTFITVEGDPTYPTAIVNGLPFWNGTEHRINPNFATRNETGTFGNSRYNALQVVADKRQSHGLQFQVAYTYSKATDDTGERDGVDCGSASGMNTSDYFGPGMNKFAWGPACIDNTDHVRLSTIYHIPNVSSDNFFSKVEHGWWSSVIWSGQTGFPFTPVLSTNRSHSQYFQTAGDWASVVTPADVTYCQTNACDYTPVIYNPKTVTKHNPLQWYNPNMFKMAPMVPAPGSTAVCTSTTCGTGTTYGTLGDASRGMLSGPGYEDVDASLVKDAHLPYLGEQGSFEFRAEIFNILNHPNFNSPSGTTFTGAVTDYGSFSEAPLSTAGRIASTSNTSRQIQFSMKVMF